MMYIDDQQSIVSTDLYEAFHQEDEFKRKKIQICVLPFSRKRGIEIGSFLHPCFLLLAYKYEVV